MIMSSEVRVSWPDVHCTMMHAYAARHSHAGLVARGSLLGVYRCSLQVFPPHQKQCAI